MIVQEPIVGWRRWNFMYPHFLANLGNDTIYVPREKIEAHCEQYSTIGALVLRKDHSEQPAPHLTCMCGIHAYKEKSRLLREIRYSLFPPAICSGLRLVYGEINLWGKVIEHEDGYRAQFGYPKRLWCTPAIEPLAGWIGYVYGVPCEVMPSGDDEEIKINSPRSIITKYDCGRYYHVGFCPKCFVLNIKAKRKEKWGEVNEISSQGARTN
ncbi:MAG: hypothetical protein HY646_17920 [Acidobacteria bacterium]|nr:hypothetical protein [Acidobacteriota bacterium]